MIQKSVKLDLVDLRGDGFHLLVDIELFGGYFKAVLDTGASKSAFDKEIIEGLCEDTIEHLPDQHAVGLGTTTMERYVAHFSSLKIGELIIDNYEAPVFDLSSIKFAYQQLNLPIVIGVIGGDVLHHYKAVIDYRNLELIFHLE